jgi:hypothetical protein
MKPENLERINTELFQAMNLGEEEQLLGGDFCHWSAVGYYTCTPPPCEPDYYFSCSDW